MELNPNPKATRRNKRVGRGIGSGSGKTCGRGHNGQRSRTGSSIPAWFEGGQNPLYRRIPKRGFTNIFATDNHEVNIGKLALVVSSASTVSDKIDVDELKKLSIIGKKILAIKLLGHIQDDEKDKLSALSGKTLVVNMVTKSAQKLADEYNITLQVEEFKNLKQSKKKEEKVNA